MAVALDRFPKIRVYDELGPAFGAFDASAAWEDFNVGVEHLARWERTAVVTDVAWIRFAPSAFRVLTPGQLRVFAVNEASVAGAWIRGA